MNILDTDDVPISQISLQQEETADSQIIVIRVPCQSGLFLTADGVSEARVLVREHGVGSYQDIHTSPIDLAPHDGSNQDFDLKVHTGSVTGIVSVAVDVKVTHNP